MKHKKSELSFFWIEIADVQVFCKAFSRVKFKSFKLTLLTSVQKYKFGGLNPTFNNPKVSYVEGETVGGGSEVNSGLYHQAPENILLKWSKEYSLLESDYSKLSKYYKDIEEKLEILKLIEKYLKFIGEENHYKKADGIVEHFYDLNNILVKEKRAGASIDEQLAYQNIGFQLISDGITQRELRSMKKIIVEEKSKRQLLKALEFSKPEPAEKKIRTKIKADQDESFTPARTIFNEANDTVKAVSDSSKPLTNLERAFTNLDTIDTKNPTMNTFFDLLE